MIAKTKFEKKIVQLKDQLPPVSQEILDNIYQRHIRRVGFTSNGDVCYCGNCGKSFPITEVIGAYIDDLKKRKKDPCGHCPRFFCSARYEWRRRKYVFNPQTCCYFNQKILYFDTYCPHCKERLYVHYANIRKVKATRAASILTTFNGIQIWRNFNLSVDFVKGKACSINVQDVCVIWIDENGDFRSVRKKRHGPNERDDKGRIIPSLTNDDKDVLSRRLLHIYCQNLYDEIELADYLKIRGLGILSAGKLEAYNRLDTDIFHEGANPILFIKNLLKYPYIETLVKQGDFETLHAFFSYSKKEFETFLPSYLIIKRHRYTPSDLKLWIDMVLLYHATGKDIRNPRFICPADLQKGHEEAQTLYDQQHKRRIRAVQEEYERTRPRDIWWYLDHHLDEAWECCKNSDYLYQLAEQYGGLEPGWHIYWEDFLDDATGEIIGFYRRVRDPESYNIPVPVRKMEDPVEINEKRDKHFEKLKGKFFNLEFGDDELRIKTLNSWEEYYQEGQAMHNCVESNGYWNKPSTLVFSVRTEKGIVADVEVSLKSFRMLQCWGPSNSVTPYKDKIKQLIEENVHLIKERIKDRSS